MVGRFVDDLEFLKEAEDFSRRNDGVSLWRIGAAFGVAFMLIVASFTLIGFDSIFLIIAVVAMTLIGLLYIMLYYLVKERNIVAVVELQNAIFSGAAQLVTELCIIVRKDGKVVYISPEYRRKILKDNNSKEVGLDSFVKAGAITKEEKDKLKAALAEGKNTKITFHISENEEVNSPVAFTLHPIGMYQKNERTKGIKLATQPIARPSGYYLLESPKEDKDLLAEIKKNEVINQFPVGYYSIKKNGEFDEIGGALEANLGYEAGELESLGLKFNDLFYEEEVLAELLKAKSDWQAILPLRNKENMIVSSIVNHRVVKGKNNSVTKCYGIIVPFNQSDALNVSDDVGQGEALDIVNNSPIATAVLDDKGAIQTSNKAFRQIATRKDKRKKFTKLQDFISGDDRSQIKNLIEGVASGKIEGFHPTDVKIIGEADETASLYLSRIMGKHGNVRGLIAHLIDTTELKNLEMRFVHSQKMQAVGQLAGGIAHDFNNLLTAMMGFCDLLLIKHPAGDASFADIMQIKQNANRAANLVRQLLAFSRKQTLQPKIISITDSLADLSNLIGRLIGENIELKMEYGRDIGCVRVDQGQLEQVIINLAVNARDAMGEGGTLIIRTSNVKIDAKTKLNRSLIPPSGEDVIVPGDYVLVEVVDTGCGMEKEKISKIFEPFYSTKELGAGTGLGLSTVYGIIKQTEGYVYVSSKIGKGSNFSIFLKRYVKEEVAEPDEKKAHAQITVATDLSGQGTVLLVEDETPVRIFSNSALKGKGYNVLEAECAEKALEIMNSRGKEIDIIVTDVVMPGMSGPDMIKKISQKFPDIKVVFMSGYGEDAFMESYGDERKFNFLSKPYTLKQLATKVKEVIESE